MAILKTEAIVLKTFDFRETSLIVNFFTKEYGRVDGILKGIRKDPRKFGSTLEPFSLNEIVFYQSRHSSLHLVSQCDLKDNFNTARSNLKAIAFASYLVDLLRHFMPAEEKNQEVYTLSEFALERMDAGADVEKVLRIFVIKFLKLIGFRPRLDGCIVCDRNILGSAYFNVKRGGLICPKCRSSDGYSTEVFGGTVASILHIEQNNWQDALRLGLSGNIKEELNRILQSFMEFHLQVKPKSQEFLEILR